MKLFKREIDAVVWIIFRPVGTGSENNLLNCFALQSRKKHFSLSAKTLPADRRISAGNERYFSYPQAHKKICRAGYDQTGLELQHSTACHI